MDVIYRRVDEAFLDPSVSFGATVCSAPRSVDRGSRGKRCSRTRRGTAWPTTRPSTHSYRRSGALLPGEEPLLAMCTYLGLRDECTTDVVLDQLPELVVKAGRWCRGLRTAEVGPRRPRSSMIGRPMLDDPRRYDRPAALFELSACPQPRSSSRALVPRHVDLRPFMRCSRPDGSWVLPGGLTRVALVERGAPTWSTRARVAAPRTRGCSLGNGAGGPRRVHRLPPTGDFAPLSGPGSAGRTHHAIPTATAATADGRSSHVEPHRRVAVLRSAGQVERAEDTSRILDVHLTLLLDDPSAP